MAFSLGSPTGGALTAANAATGDKFPVVDVSVGASDSANKTMTTLEKAKLMANIRGDFSGFKTPPLAADVGTTWSWDNQTTATATQDTAGNFTLAVVRSASDQGVFLFRSMPATPYSIIIEYDFAGNLSNYVGHGLAVKDSGTGRIVTLEIVSNGGLLQVVCDNYNTSTSGSGAGNLTPANVSIHTQFRYMKITDNGSTFSTYVGHDCMNWFRMSSAVSRTAWLATPNQVGFFIRNYSASNFGVGAFQMVVKDFWIA